MKWSSIKNGLKFGNCGVPTERRTLAPAPSAFSIALKAFTIVRATDIVAGRSISVSWLNGDKGVATGTNKFCSESKVEAKTEVEVAQMVSRLQMRTTIDDAVRIFKGFPSTRTKTLIYILWPSRTENPVETYSPTTVPQLFRISVMADRNIRWAD